MTKHKEPRHQATASGVARRCLMPCRILALHSCKVSLAAYQRFEDTELLAETRMWRSSATHPQVAPEQLCLVYQLGVC